MTGAPVTPPVGRLAPVLVVVALVVDAVALLVELTSQAAPLAVGRPVLGRVAPLLPEIQLLPAELPGLRAGQVAALDSLLDAAPLVLQAVREGVGSRRVDREGAAAEEGGEGEPA